MTAAEILGVLLTGDPAWAVSSGYVVETDTDPLGVVLTVTDGEGRSTAYTLSATEVA